MHKTRTCILLGLVLTLVIGCGGGSGTDDALATNACEGQDALANKDMLHPDYYSSADFKTEADAALCLIRQESFGFPLDPGYQYTLAPAGAFGADKGTPPSTEHPAIDLYPPANSTDTAMNIYAIHAGYVSLHSNVLKYGNYIGVTSDVPDGSGKVAAKLETLYAHVDLTASNLIEGQYVNKADLLVPQLTGTTVGGPHLHLESRLYRATDLGTEDYYGQLTAGRTLPSLSSDYPLGYWTPNVGYGFVNPVNLGFSF